MIASDSALDSSCSRRFFAAGIPSRSHDKFATTHITNLYKVRSPKQPEFTSTDLGIYSQRSGVPRGARPVRFLRAIQN